MTSEQHCNICGKNWNYTGPGAGNISHHAALHEDTLIIAARDEKIAELRLALTMERKAVEELMAEGISKKRAADWAIINDAGGATQKALGDDYP